MPQQPYSSPSGQSLTPGYGSSNYDGDSRDHSRSRSRDGRKHHHHHHHHDRPGMGKKKGSGVSTFLGAGGGAIIGDAIFPGLGTLGGAILGGVSGHEFGKQRRSYSDTGKSRGYDDGDYDDRGRRY